MSPHLTKKVFSKEEYSKDAEEWEYIEEEVLNHSRSACVCMTCYHFSHICDRHSRTLLTCLTKHCLIPDGKHLNSKCSMWLARL